MAKALMTAQVQSVREIKKKAEIKKANKKATIFVLALFISLIILYLGFLSYNYYINSRYEYKEAESGVVFYSKDFGVRNAITKVFDTSSILVAIDILEENTENTEYVTDTIVFFNSILVYKNIPTITQINVLDSKGNLTKCITNKGDVYTNEELFANDCLEQQENASSRILISSPNASLKTPEAYIHPETKTILFKPQSHLDVMKMSYITLKSNFSDLEEILEKIELTKKDISENVGLEPN